MMQSMPGAMSSLVVVPESVAEEKDIAAPVVKPEKVLPPEGRTTQKWVASKRTVAAKHSHYLPARKPHPGPPLSGNAETIPFDLPENADVPYTEESITMKQEVRVEETLARAKVLLDEVKTITED
jgi:hypothetical protein